MNSSQTIARNWIQQQNRRRTRILGHKVPQHAAQLAVGAADLGNPVPAERGIRGRKVLMFAHGWAHMELVA